MSAANEEKGIAQQDRISGNESDKFVRKYFILWKKSVYTLCTSTHTIITSGLIISPYESSVAIHFPVDF